MAQKAIPLPVPIPLDIADQLHVHPTLLNHANAGRRMLPLKLCDKIMEIAETDPRLDGLLLIHLRPDLRPICKRCKRRPRRRK